MIRLGWRGRLRGGWGLAEVAAWVLFAATLLEYWVSLADPATRAHYFLADYLYLPTLFADIFEWGGRLRDWQLTPAPNFFPDMPLYAAARFTFGSMELSQYFAGLAQLVLLGWALRLLLSRLFPQFPGAGLLAPLSLAASTSLFLTAHLEPWRQLLLPVVHGGAAVNGVWCLALTASQVRAPSRTRLGLLVLWALLGSVSDGLFAIGWVLSSLTLGAVGLVGRAWRPGRWGVEPFAFLFWPGVAGVLGTVVARVLMPLQRNYMDLRLKDLQTSLTRMSDAISSYSKFALAFELLALVVFVVALWRAIRSPGRPWGALEGVAAVALGGGLASWLVVLVTGTFLDVFSFRYLLVPMVFGLVGSVVAVGWASARVRSLGAPVALGLAAVAILGLNPGRWRELGLEARLDDSGRELSRCVARLADQEGSPTVLGDYWGAKGTTLYAGGQIRVLQLNGEATGPLPWITDTRWYCSPAAPGLLIADGLQEAGIEALGAPDAVVQCGASRVLVYRGEHRAALGALIGPGRARCAE